jgi:DNA-binding CsgD family transcriptional regulator
MIRAWSNPDARRGARAHRRRTVAVQANYEWITVPKLRVLGELAELRTERQIADRFGIKYNTVRGIVADIKNHTGLADVREIGRWWRMERPKYVLWMAQQAGVDLKADGS